VTSRSRREETLRQRWLEVLRAELVYREEGDDGGARREQLVAEFVARLDEMAERMCAAPGYVEPSEAQKAQSRQRLDVWFDAWLRDRRGDFTR
jgi:hypothetical protein